MTQETQTWRQLRARVEKAKGKLGPRWKGESDQLRGLHRGLDRLLQQIELMGKVHGWNVPAVGEIAETLAAHRRSEQKQDLETLAYENDPNTPLDPHEKS